jgi:TetR/AcrR family transcriptional regulator, cholesterol catabolism regulator
MTVVPPGHIRANPETGDRPTAEANLYLVAANLFHQRGYHATSMSDLAKALNMTKAGLYYYINSKEDLLYRIMDGSLTWVEKSVITPARTVSDPEARLRYIIETHGQRLMGGERAIPLLIDEDAALTPEHRSNVGLRKQAYIDLVRGTLDELRVQGRLRAVSSVVATFSVFATLLAIPRWYPADSPLPVPQALREIASVLLDGLLLKSSHRAGD